MAAVMCDKACANATVRTKNKHHIEIKQRQNAGVGSKRRRPRKQTHQTRDDGGLDQDDQGTRRLWAVVL